MTLMNWTAVSAIAAAMSAIVALIMVWLAKKQLEHTAKTIGLANKQLEITVRTIKDENLRRKTQETIDAVQAADLRFQKDYWKLENTIFKKKEKLDLAVLDEEDKQTMEGALTPLEYLGVGSKRGLYDVNVIAEMCGHYLLHIYAKTEPYILQSRDPKKCGDKAHGSRYIEFQELCEKLKECDYIKKHPNYTEKGATLDQD